MKQLDGQIIKKLIAPSPRLKPFIVKDFQNDQRLAIIAEQLYERPLWMPDEGRNYDAIWQLIYASLLNPLNVFYEIGNMKGIVGFMNVFKGHKGEFVLMLFDKYTHRIHKDVEKIIKLIADAFELKRLFTQTPDEKMAKLYEMLGFKIEGRQKYGFKWDGKFYTNILLRRLF